MVSSSSYPWIISGGEGLINPRMDSVNFRAMSTGVMCNGEDFHKISPVASSSSSFIYINALDVSYSLSPVFPLQTPSCITIVQSVTQHATIAQITEHRYSSPSPTLPSGTYVTRSESIIPNFFSSFIPTFVP